MRSERIDGCLSWALILRRAAVVAPAALSENERTSSAIRKLEVLTAVAQLSLYRLFDLNRATPVLAG
jgi:hypothetical protein